MRLVCFQCIFYSLLTPGIKGDEFIKEFVPQVDLFTGAHKNWFAYIKSFVHKFLMSNPTHEHYLFIVVSQKVTQAAEEFLKASMVRQANHNQIETEPDWRNPEVKLIEINGFVNVTRPTGLIVSEQQQVWVNIGQNTCKFYKTSTERASLHEESFFGIPNQFDLNVFSLPFQYLRQLKLSDSQAGFTSDFGWKVTLGHNLSQNLSFIEMYIPVRTCEQGSLHISGGRQNASLFCGHYSSFNFYPLCKPVHINIKKGKFTVHKVHISQSVMDAHLLHIIQYLIEY